MEIKGYFLSRLYISVMVWYQYRFVANGGPGNS